MSERETQKIKAPIAGIEFELNTYITGGEMIELEAVGVGNGMKSVDARSGQMTLNAEQAYRKRLRKLVDIIIVKAGEETEKEKIWLALTALRSSDYSFVMRMIERAADGSSLTEDEGKE